MASRTGVPAPQKEADAGEEEASHALAMELNHLMKAVSVINHLAVSLDINAAMESVQEVALELLDCERVTLFLVFDRLRELRAKGHDLSGKRAHLIKVKFGEGIAGRVAQTGQLMNVPDAYDHPLFNSTVDKDTGYQTKSLLCCAIRDMSGHNVAVLQALNKKDNQPFSSADERNLELFGTHLGNTLAKARLHEQAEANKHRLSALFNCFKVLSTASSLGQVIEFATVSLRDVLNAEYAFVFIMDVPRGELWMQCCVDAQSGDILLVRVHQGEGLVGRCGLDHSEPIDIANYDGTDELISSVMKPLLTGGQPTSLLVQPVFQSDHSGKVAAVVLAINKLDVQCEAGGSDMFFEDFFTESDINAMSLFALELGDALSSRSLEVAYASALSVVNSDGMAHTRGGVVDVRGRNRREDTDLALRSQLMSMYFSPSTTLSLVGSTERRSQAGSMYKSHAPSGPLTTVRSMGNWQSALIKLTDSLLEGHQEQEGRGKGSSLPGHGAENGSPAAAAAAPAGAGLQRSMSMSVHPRSASRLAMLAAHAKDAASSTSSSFGNRPHSFSHGTQVVPALHTLRRSAHPTVASHAASTLLQGGAAASTQQQQQQQRRQRSQPPKGPPQMPRRLQPTPGAASSSRQGGGAAGIEEEAADGAAQVRDLDSPKAAEVAPETLGQALGAAAGPAAGTSGLPTPTQHPAEKDGPETTTAAVVPQQREAEDPLLLLQATRPLGSSSRSKLREEALDGRGDDAQRTAGGLAPGGPEDGWPARSAPSAADGVPGAASSVPPHSPPGEGGRGRAAAAAEEEEEEEEDCRASVKRSDSDTPAMMAYQRTWSADDSMYSCGAQHASVAHSFEQLASWDFRFVNATQEQMSQICFDLFSLSGAMEHFHLSAVTLRNLISAVSSHYHDIPYHNFNHVCHVLQSTWIMLQTPVAKQVLSVEDHLGVMLAALCHDLDHDGKSNSFHVHTESQLARLYNDTSVMENHHCAMTFEILRRKDCALLEHLDKPVQMRLRKTIIASIQCTDMTNHFVMTQDFRNHALEFDPEVDADRLLLGKVILHAADIGNAVRPFAVNDVMSKRVHRELSTLAEEEQRLGVPVTFLIDSSNPLICAKMECNFLDYIVVPLWERVAEVLGLSDALRTLMRNRECYHGIANGSRGPMMGGALEEEEDDGARVQGPANATGAVPGALQ